MEIHIEQAEDFGPIPNGDGHIFKAYARADGRSIEVIAHVSGTVMSMGGVDIGSAVSDRIARELNRMPDDIDRLGALAALGVIEITSADV
jgi:hypothetical protein